MKCNFACHLNFTVMRDILLDHNATGHMELLRQVVVFSQISARVIPTHLNRFYSMSAAPKIMNQPDQTQPNPPTTLRWNTFTCHYFTISTPCLDIHGLIKSNSWPLKSIHGSQRYKRTVLVTATKR